MRFSTIAYYFKEAINSLIRNRLMSLASTATVIACIFMMSFSFCIAANLDYMLTQVSSTIAFPVYLKDDLDPVKAFELLDKVKAIPNVKNVVYISSDDALDNLIKDWGEDAVALEGLRAKNPLPRSFEIEVSDPKQQAFVVQEIEKLKEEGIEEIKLDQDITNIIITLNNSVRVVSLIVIGILIVISVVIIMNTVKITVNSRKTEINIMKYVGATDWFIRWPFVIEGVLIGIVGSIIPILFCMFTYNEAVNYATSVLPINNFVLFRTDMEIFSFLAPFAIGMGIFMGTLGSVWSLRRHLKV